MNGDNNVIDLTEDFSSTRNTEQSQQQQQQQFQQQPVQNNHGMYPNISLSSQPLQYTQYSTQASPFSKPLDSRVFTTMNYVPNIPNQYYGNQQVLNIPPSLQVPKPSPTDHYSKMVRDSYSQPKILNTHQFLSKNGIDPNSTTFIPYTQLASQAATGVPTSVPKQRVLPATVVVPPPVPPVVANNAFQQNFLNRQQIMNNYGTYYKPNTTATSSLPQSHLQKTVQMVFSLINADEFTARVETGSVRVELVRFLSSVQGGSFDHKAKRFVFPLVLHDQLQVKDRD